MNDLIAMVTERDGVPITTSRAIAEQFGKSHKNVLQSIEKLVSQLKNQPANVVFAEQNFLQIEQADAQGKPRPAYLLTRDGFTLLAMGFTGAKAMQFKIAYINAFNRMEQILRGGGLSSGTLQRIEERLDALENIAGNGKEEAGESIATIFLQAIKDAVTSGEYYIRNKWAKQKQKPEGQLLGVIDGSRVCIKSKQAYKIYSSVVTAPISNSVLWAILEEFKTIAPRAEVGRERNIDRQRVGVIYIDADKIKELL